MNRGNPLLLEVFPTNLHHREVTIESKENFSNVLEAYKVYHDIKIELQRPYVYGLRIVLTENKYKIYGRGEVSFFINDNLYFFDFIITEKDVKVIDKNNEDYDLVAVYSGRVIYLYLVNLFYRLGFLYDFSTGNAIKYPNNTIITNTHEVNSRGLLLTNSVNSFYYPVNKAFFKFFFLYVSCKIEDINIVRTYQTAPNTQVAIDAFQFSTNMLSGLLVNLSAGNTKKVSLFFDADNIAPIPPQSESLIYYINARLNKYADFKSVYGDSLLVNAHNLTSWQNINVREGNSGVYNYNVVENQWNYGIEHNGVHLALPAFRIINTSNAYGNYTMPLITTNNIKTSGFLIIREQTGNNVTYRMGSPCVPGEFIRNVWNNMSYMNYLKDVRAFHNSYNINRVRFINSFPNTTNTLVFSPGTSIYWDHKYDVNNRRLKSQVFSLNTKLGEATVGFGSQPPSIIKHLYWLSVFPNNPINHYTASKNLHKINNKRTFALEATRYTIVNDKTQTGVFYMQNTASQNANINLTASNITHFFVTSS